MDYPVIELTRDSPQYPQRLQQISDAPERIFCRGNIELLNSECFAVVGTRMITGYGKEAVQKIVPGLARHFTIVSGLALGIDACAHRTTLDCAGKTIAVLGTPVSDPSPRSNNQLAKDILNNAGLLVSEYETANEVFKGNFAERDRIISGLARGVLVVEGDEKSGSLITAKCALDQNRDVFAVPGNIFSPKSIGPNKLIQRGAKLVSSVADIIEDYSMLDLKPSAMSTDNPTHALILAILETNGPLGADAIIERARKEVSEIMAALSVMEIRGLVRQMSGGIFRKAD